MEMFYCYIMSPLPVTARGARDMSDVSVGIFLDL